MQRSQTDEIDLLLQLCIYPPRLSNITLKVYSNGIIHSNIISTGTGLWGSSQPISNNSAVIADSAGQIGTIYCHSASQQPHIGRWISQAGNDITFTSTDAFDIGLHSGDFPSYTPLTLSTGFVLMAADQGVYSCQIPDENGTQSTLHIGIYSNGYGGNFNRHHSGT